jgi:hypothetical protein
MNEELPKIMAGIERHIHTVRTVQGGFATSGQTLASAVWELGTMCSLSGKSLKDMSVEMERAEAATKVQRHEERPTAKPVAQEQQPNLFG